MAVVLSFDRRRSKNRKLLHLSPPRRRLLLRRKASRRDPTNKQMPKKRDLKMRSNPIGTPVEIDRRDEQKSKRNHHDSDDDGDLGR